MPTSRQTTRNVIEAGKTPAPSDAQRAVSKLLNSFLDSLGMVTRLAQELVGDEKSRAAATSKAGAELAFARYLWEKIAKYKDAPSHWLNALLVKSLPRIENLITAPWPEFAHGAVSDNLAGVYAQVVIHLTNWLRACPLTEQEWALFELTPSAAREAVGRALNRWATAIEGNEDLEVFQDQMRRAIASKSLPPILDKFDPAALNEFLTSIYRRVVLLKDKNASECANFIEDTASVFWEACIAYYRTEKLERIAVLGQEILPTLAAGVSRNGCDLLKILPRVMKSFDLHTPNSRFRNYLHSELRRMKEDQLPQWSAWALEDERFRHLLHEAHVHGLREAITGELRSVPVRFNLEGQKFHSTEVPQLREEGGQYALPCTLEDISQDCSGVQFVVIGGHPEPTGKGVWFTFGDEGHELICDLNQCTVELPFDSPTQWAKLQVECRWIETIDNKTRIGATIVAKDNLSAWAEYVVRRLAFALDRP